MPTPIFISASGVSTHGPKSSEPPNEPNPSVDDRSRGSIKKALPFLGSPEAHDFHHSLNGGRNLDNLGQVDVLDRVLHTNKEFLKSWQYTVHKGYSTPDYPVDKALATTEKPLPA